MGHSITAIVLKGNIHSETVDRYDLRGVELHTDLHLYFVDNYYSSVWQHRFQMEGFLVTDADYVLFPKERVLARIAQEVTDNPQCEFAIIATDYFGGAGDQWAQVYRGDQNVGSSCSINQALKTLGVQRQGDKDEFETVGLDKLRSQPDYLESYSDLAEELGL